MSEIKVEVGQIRRIDKGALKAFFSLLIHPEGQKILDCRYFSKGDARWWTMPQKEIKKQDGQKSDFLPIISYTNKQYETQLKDAVLKAIKDEVDGAQNKTPSRQESPLQGETPDIWF